MESPLPENMKCPDPETLSAVYDGECTEQKILAHVRQCPLCCRHLEELEELTRILRNALKRATPPDIAERILAGVQAKNKDFHRRFNFYSRPMVFARVAALAAILGVVGVLIWNEMAESEEPVALPHRVAAAASTASELSEPAGVPGYRKLGAIDVSELADASFSNMPASAPHSVPGKDSTQLPVAIPDNVDQVWSVPVRSAFRAENLQKLIRSLGIPDGDVEFETSGKRFSVRFHGTKMQSVRFCAELQGSRLFTAFARSAAAGAEPFCRSCGFRDPLQCDVHPALNRFFSVRDPSGDIRKGFFFFLTPGNNIFRNRALKRV